MSTITVMYNDSEEQYKNCKGGGPINDTLFGIHTEDDVQHIITLSRVLGIRIEPDMGDKMGLNNIKGGSNGAG